MFKKLVALFKSRTPSPEEPLKTRNIYILGKGGESQLKTALTVGLLRKLYKSFEDGQIYIIDDLNGVTIASGDLLIGDVSESDVYAVIGPETEGVDVLHKAMLKCVDLHTRIVIIEICKLANSYERQDSSKASSNNAFGKISGCPTLLDAISAAEKNWSAYIQEGGENEFAL